ncbi:TetR/AcrR family transcriptional regulator [Desulforamulus hydrothermalis]|uniref:Transcriptional regulator, TetR family n=1 Tax=Desulforamulus hydrothermalis Lam5 = DSM 18033 TaxID=1121428 RepID=K8EEX0_9FIRM|nr:TetR/AcrR family transcriptional regulator [Desulforamulus hydrothermalis]CCO07286.1 Transcriptional regulator, TetR family [Desulforamulus hydrothermalis Lam5 = DSM 18033]SHG93194.1 transcriptional regulator, TetR family [Desulforamulus hydrothermalis Lam5 = DSM 18033]
MATRERIVLCFKKLSEERGFYGATVDELAARNNMSKRTIYRYFKSKEEIIEAVLQMTMLEIERGVLEILGSSENPIEKITGFVKFLSEKLRSFNPRIMGDLQRHYPEMWERVEKFRGEKIKYLAQIMVEGSKEGYFKEMNPTIVTASLLAAVRAVVNPTFILENNLTPEEAFKTIMHTFLYGIVAKDSLG